MTGIPGWEAVGTLLSSLFWTSLLVVVGGIVGTGRRDSSRIPGNWWAQAVEMVGAADRPPTSPIVRRRFHVAFRAIGDERV